MANHGILETRAIVAQNVDAYNRSAVGSADLDNGSAVILASMSATAGYGEVWTATQPVTGSLGGLWMVNNPDTVVVTANGKSYKGINPDLRDFYTASGQVFTCYKPQVGDIIVLSADAITGVANTYVVAANAAYKMAFAAAAGAGLSYKVVETTYLSLPTGGIDTGRIVAYKLECVLN